MNEAAPNRPESSETLDGAEKQGTAQYYGGIVGDIERFSRLSSELKDCLSGITRKIIKSLDELKSIQQAITQKKHELKEVYAVETSASALDNLREEHRLKQSEFESFMESQRRLWEEEKALREKEDEEYRQALKLRRKREEEEYNHKLAREQLLVRQKLEEELRQIRRQTIEKQELLKQDLIKREQALKEKELEWVRLIQELEMFMTRLVERTRKKDDVRVSGAMDHDTDAMPMHGGAAADVPVASNKNEGIEEETKIADEPDVSANPSVESIREMLLSQGRRIENIQSDVKDNRDPVPFRLRPRDNV